MNMNVLEETIDKIDKYPKKYICLCDFSKIINIKQTTLAAQINHKVIPSRFDGYKHHISKQTAKDIALKHKSAILGWIRQKELLVEFDTRSQSLFHICQSRQLHNEQDYLGHVRFPPETVIKLREILPLYLAKDIVEHKDQTYYSLVRLSHDMAKKIETDENTKLFKYEKERIYQCIYSWCQRKLLPYISIDGYTRIYVDETNYNNMVNLIRVKDSAFLCGMSRRTIYQWIKKGILPTNPSPSGHILIDIQNLDNVLVLRMQLELIREYVHNPQKLNELSEFDRLHEIDEISDLYSAFWQKMSSHLSTLGQDYKNINNGEGKKKYLENSEGWNKARIRAVKSIMKSRRKTASISLDAKIEEDMTLMNVIEDKSILTPDGAAEKNDILPLIKTLNKDDYDIICRLFGFNDCDITTIENIAQEKNMLVLDLQNHIDKILNDLKEKLE